MRTAQASTYCKDVALEGYKLSRQMPGIRVLTGPQKRPVASVRPSSLSAPVCWRRHGELQPQDAVCDEIQLATGRAAPVLSNSKAPQAAAQGAACEACGPAWERNLSDALAIRRPAAQKLSEAVRQHPGGVPPQQAERPPTSASVVAAVQGLGTSRPHSRKGLGATTRGL